MRILTLLVSSPCTSASVFGSWSLSSPAPNGHGRGVANRNNRPPVDPSIHEPAASSELREWQIKGLTRWPDPGLNTTTWECTIVDVTAGGTETNCYVVAPDSDPVASFYGIPCASGSVSGASEGATGSEQAAKYELSWGYNEEADSAVVTVCFTPNGTSAWFGFEQVSHNQLLGDSNPMPVYYSGCA